MATIYYLVGIPASGKSTFAEQLMNESNTLILSSDRIREELYGDESIQGNPQQVFEVMNKRAIECLNNGVNVIYDATNLNRRRRINFLKTLPKDTNKECIIVWDTLENCILRDSQRKRTVGKDVILQMIKNFQTPFYDEGWDKIVIRRNGKYSTEELTSAMSIPHDNPHHNNSIIEHTTNVINEVEELYKRNEIDSNLYSLLSITALYHDVGKPLCKTFKDSKGNGCDIAHYYNHQNVSSYFVLGVKDIIGTLEEKDILRISYWINLHLELYNPSKYFNNLDSYTKGIMETFRKCDKRGA